MLKLLPYPIKSGETRYKTFIFLSPYIRGYMRKQNAVIILKNDYRYITKVCIHAFLSLKISKFVLNVNKTYKIVLLLSEKTSYFLLVHVGCGNKGSNCICSAPFVLSNSLRDLVGKTGEYMLKVRNLSPFCLTIT